MPLSPIGGGGNAAASFAGIAATLQGATFMGAGGPTGMLFTGMFAAVAIPLSAAATAFDNRTLGGQGTGALEQIAERHAVDKGHRVPDEALAFAHEMDRQDVRMLEPGDAARFALEPLDRARRPRHVGTQHLHGQAPLQVLVPDLVDLRKAAGADEAFDFILGAEGAGKRGERVVWHRRLL